MTRVDFYILDSADSVNRSLFVCRLAEKAWRMGHTIHIQTNQLADAESLDELLWNFKAEAFIPHALAPTIKSTPIHIGYGGTVSQHHDLLINLCNEVPLFFSSFERVAEVVTQAPDQLAISRERFRFYRQRGYALESHKIISKGTP